MAGCSQHFPTKLDDRNGTLPRRSKVTDCFQGDGGNLFGGMGLSDPVKPETEGSPDLFKHALILHEPTGFPCLRGISEGNLKAVEGEPLRRQVEVPSENALGKVPNLEKGHGMLCE